MTIQLFDRGPNHPLWTVITEGHLVTDGKYTPAHSIFDSLYQIGDEVGIVMVKNHDNGWSLFGLKKTEVERFLNEYQLSDQQGSPRYVRKISC